LKTDYPRNAITAIILAGGQGRRMGGQDKGLIEIGGKPMVEHVLDAVGPQAAAVVISANRNLERYRALGCAVVADATGDSLGPLAGILAGLAATTTRYALVVPCDAPLLPADLGRRLYTALRRAGKRLAVAHDGERVQPLFLLMDTGLGRALDGYFKTGGRRVDLWVKRQRPAVADFHSEARAFTNVNEPADMKAPLRHLAARYGSG
jgi:molybdopterin-guanine dinucleotide biosynthesis protein A